MKQGERKIGKQVFFSVFARRLTKIEGRHNPPPFECPPRRDDTRARISAPMKFRGYYREALVLKYTPGVWHLQFQRGEARFGLFVGWRKAGQTARPGHKHKLQVSSWIETRLCYWPPRFQCDTDLSSLLNVIPLLEVFIYMYSSKYDFDSKKMG